MRKLGTCLGFNLFGNARDHAVEQVDVFVGVIVGAGKEKIGDTAKDIRLFVGRSRCEGPFDLSDNRPLFEHGFERPGMRKSGYL